MRTLAVCLSLLALACASTSDSAHDGASARTSASSSRPLADLMPRPLQPFTLRATAKSAPSLVDVLLELERATGAHFVVPDEAREQLARASSGLLSDLEVPPEAAWRVVQTMLVENGFVVEPSRGGAPVTVTLASRTSRGSGTLKERAVVVDAAEIEACVDLPAVIFLVVVEVEALDARQLSTTLRQLYPDQQTQSILPTTDSQLVLVGLGPTLAESVRMIRTCDAEERQKREEQRAKSAADPSAAPR